MAGFNVGLFIGDEIFMILEANSVRLVAEVPYDYDKISWSQ